MEQKQMILAQMLTLQHLFEPQSDPTSQAVVSQIKRSIDQLAKKKVQGVNIPPAVRPIGTLIRKAMREQGFALTAQQRDVLFDLESRIIAIENQFMTGIPTL